MTQCGRRIHFRSGVALGLGPCRANLRPRLRDESGHTRVFSARRCTFQPCYPVHLNRHWDAQPTASEASQRALEVIRKVARFAGGIPFGPLEIEHRTNHVGDELGHGAVALLPRRVRERYPRGIRVRDRNATELLTSDYPWSIHPV